MTGKELQTIRRHLFGMDKAAFGRAIGLKADNEASLISGVKRLETYTAVPETISLLAAIYFKNPSLAKKTALARGKS